MRRLRKGDDDPKPDDDSRKTPAVPPKAMEPPSVVKDEADWMARQMLTGQNADLASSGPPSEVGEIGMVITRKNIMTMMNILKKKKKKKINDTRH